VTRRTFVYIVCAPHPRVGATTTARLLADFFAHQGRAFEGFDTDPHEQPFADRFPREARVIDLSAIQGQISLFDHLLVLDETPKIVDVWNRGFHKFFSIVHDIGFFQEARRQMIEPVLLYLIDETPACLETALQLSGLWPDLSMVFVSNEGAMPLEGRAIDVLARFPGQLTFQIPALDPVVARTIEKPGFSLSRFALAPPTDMSIVVRVALQAWLGRIFAQFQSFELRIALNDSEFLR
jgi:hypothetical protein